MTNYLLWRFVPGRGWFTIDRTRRETRRPDGSASPAVDLVGLLTQRNARLAYLRGGSSKRPAEPRAWLTVTTSDVDLQTDWVDNQR